MTSVYAIVFENCKVYIGVSKNMKKRIHTHELGKRKEADHPLYRAMRKYRYKFEIVETFQTRKEAYGLEMKLIEETDGYNYNLAKGGPASGRDTWTHSKIGVENRKRTLREMFAKRLENGFRFPTRRPGEFAHTQESKDKMSVSKRNMSEDTKTKMSVSRMGVTPWNKGVAGYKIHTAESKSKISEASRKQVPLRTITVYFPDGSIRQMSFTEIKVDIFENKENKTRKAVYEKRKWKEYRFVHQSRLNLGSSGGTGTEQEKERQLYFS